MMLLDSGDIERLYSLFQQKRQLKSAGATPNSPLNYSLLKQGPNQVEIDAHILKSLRGIDKEIDHNIFVDETKRNHSKGSDRLPNKIAFRTPLLQKIELKNRLAPQAKVFSQSLKGSRQHASWSSLQTISNQYGQSRLNKTVPNSLQNVQTSMVNPKSTSLNDIYANSTSFIHSQGGQTPISNCEPTEPSFEVLQQAIAKTCFSHKSIDPILSPAMLDSSSQLASPPSIYSLQSCLSSPLLKYNQMLSRKELYSREPSIKFNELIQSERIEENSDDSNESDDGLTIGEFVQAVQGCVV